MTKTNKKSVSIGFDISTQVVGICVLDNATNELLYLGHKKLSKYEDEYEKADNFTNEWFKFNEWEVKNVFIEEAAMKFSPGFSSAGTIMKLGRFNGIASHMIYKWFNVKPTMINVRKARSVLGIKIDYKDKSLNTKQKIFNHVKNLNPNFPWKTKTTKSDPSSIIYEKVNEDMADAWVICRSGQLFTSKK